MGRCPLGKLQFANKSPAVELVTIHTLAKSLKLENTWRAILLCKNQRPNGTADDKSNGTPGGEDDYLAFLAPSRTLEIAKAIKWTSSCARPETQIRLASTPTSPLSILHGDSRPNNQHTKPPPLTHRTSRALSRLKISSTNSLRLRRAASSRSVSQLPRHWTT